MASERWMFEDDCDDADVLLTEVLEPSPVQERPVVPVVAQLLEKRSGSDENLPLLYLSPSQESTQAESASESPWADDDSVSVDHDCVSEEDCFLVATRPMEKRRGSEETLPDLHLSPSRESVQRKSPVESCWVHDARVSVDDSVTGMQSLNMHLRRDSSEEEGFSLGPQQARMSENRRSDAEEADEDFLETTMGQPFFTQPEDVPSSFEALAEDDVPSTFERLMEGVGSPQIPLADESRWESMESLLDADGYIKQPPRRVLSYKPGRTSLLIGKTGAGGRKQWEKASSTLPRKRAADVDVASLLGKIADPQPIEWTRSMESTPSQSTAHSMDLFEDSDD